MKSKGIIALFFRYILLILIAIPHNLIYAILTPITIFPVLGILSLFYPGIALQGTSMLINNNVIGIISACIAGSAYYLLLILNLSTPMPIKIRIKSLAFMLVSLLVLNILRLVIFIALFVSGFSYFDITHKLSWYFGSTLLVLLIWFANVYLFKIKGIPAYTDIMSFVKEIRGKKK